MLFDDRDMFCAQEGRLVVVSTRRAPSAASTERFATGLRRHAAIHPDDERLFLLLALGAERPRLDPDARTALVNVWRDPGHRYTLAIWARRQSFAGAIQRSLITALSLLRVNEAPMRVVDGYAAALRWFENIEPDAAAAHQAWASMLASVPDFQAPSS